MYLQDSANVTPKKKGAVKAETTPNKKGAVKTEGTPQKDLRTPKKATVTPHRPDSQALASTPKRATPKKESAAQRGSIYDDKVAFSPIPLSPFVLIKDLPF